MYLEKIVMYKRAQLSVLESRMAEPRRTLHVVMGPRQVGKSTMIAQFVERTSVPYSLFSADGVGRANTAWISEKWHEARTLMMLYNETGHILIIDEIQKIDGWSETVKKEWNQDTMEKRNLKVILLGSSRLLIQKGLEEALEGIYETIKMGYGEWEDMRDAFGLTDLSHGEITGMNRYRPSRGNMNHRCPASVGKFRRIRARFLWLSAKSSCLHRSGRVEYSTEKIRNGGRIRENLLQ